MKNSDILCYTIEFHSYWHCGSGLAAGADVDALTIKDRDGLPYIPGRTMKGLIREAVEKLLAYSGADCDMKRLFGQTDNVDGCSQGCLFFSDAVLSEHERARLTQADGSASDAVGHAGKPLSSYLYTSVTSTALKDGIADDATLRRIQVTVPCVLQGCIHGVSGEAAVLTDALKLIRRIGVGRNRGLGRCRITVSDGRESVLTKPVQPGVTQAAPGDVLQFRCTLLSGVILNVKSASEGNNKTLDFIPGSNFLGIAASSLYGELAPEDTLKIFHSGKVRFGDAHPAAGKMRTLRIPSMMYYPKGKRIEDGVYLYGHYDRSRDARGENGSPMQLKQCRNGFYAFRDRVATRVVTDMNFALKSAYDADRRRSRDGAIFGYESLCKGLELYFDVETEGLSDSLKDKVRKSLVGIRHVGRSRTAQYGLVRIEEASYSEVKSSGPSGKMVTVYADSRLIFLDECGWPTFRPSASQLGCPGGRVVWEKSQVRTFQYSPWNAARQAFDTDRCGIEKGSVFVVETDGCPDRSGYVGAYNNEGFGKVIYNPEFLQPAPDADNGEAAYSFSGEPYSVRRVAEESVSVPLSRNEDDRLLRFLEGERHADEEESGIYELVNAFVKDNERKFSSEAFASQWGKLRDIATVAADDETLLRKVDEYVTKGVANSKWLESRRKDTLIDFLKSPECQRYDRRLLLVNLASQMAKKSRREE